MSKLLKLFCYGSTRDARKVDLCQTDFSIHLNEEFSLILKSYIESRGVIIFKLTKVNQG